MLIEIDFDMLDGSVVQRKLDQWWPWSLQFDLDVRSLQYNISKFSTFVESLSKLSLSNIDGAGSCDELGARIRDTSHRLEASFQTEERDIQDAVHELGGDREQKGHSSRLRAQEDKTED